MVSALVLTAVPLEALDLPLEAIELIAWLVAESSATVASCVAAAVLVRVAGHHRSGRRIGLRRAARQCRPRC